MLNSFLRCHINEDYYNPLMYHYCYIRMQNILVMDYAIHNSAILTTPYYEIIYGLIQNVLHVPGFPLVSNKDLYRFMLTSDNSRVETQYPTFNWKRIWKNFNSIIFIPYDKEIVYKHLHVCLATNQRLALMNQIASSNCTRCSENCDQTPLHMFYDCNYVKPLFLWLLRVLLDICNFKPHSNIKFLYFDNFYSNSYKRNICNMFLYIYIVTVWNTRKENLRIGILKHMIVRKV